MWGGKDPESVDDNALWKMGGFLGYSSSIVWAIFFRKVLKKLEFVPLFCVFLIQKLLCIFELMKVVVIKKGDWCNNEIVSVFHNIYMD